MILVGIDYLEPFYDELADREMRNLVETSRHLRHHAALVAIHTRMYQQNINLLVWYTSAPLCIRG